MFGHSAAVRVFAAVLILAGTARPASGQSLAGSAASLDLQNRSAREHDYTFLADRGQLRRFVAAGYLVSVMPNADLDLHRVSYPYARPEVRLFLERLASQYRRACGERLVVTSLTRPVSEQPRNASDRSVHPTGMAVDLRRSWSRPCRSWLEQVLLDLEGTGILEATRERRPAHYHVALFPHAYTGYLERRGVPFRLVSSSGASGSSTIQYRVRSGDALWTIARRYGIAVARLQSRNGLASSRITPGQVLEVPVSNGSGSTTVAYRVRLGDSLWAIARRHGTTVAQLQSWNGLASSRIIPGQVLELPVAN